MYVLRDAARAAKQEEQPRPADAEAAPAAPAPLTPEAATPTETPPPPPARGWSFIGRPDRYAPKPEPETSAMTSVEDRPAEGAAAASMTSAPEAVRPTEAADGEAKASDRETPASEATASETVASETTAADAGKNDGRDGEGSGADAAQPSRTTESATSAETASAADAAPVPASDTSPNADATPTPSAAPLPPAFPSRAASRTNDTRWPSFGAHQQIAGTARPAAARPAASRLAARPIEPRAADKASDTTAASAAAAAASMGTASREAPAKEAAPKPADARPARSDAAAEAPLAAKTRFARMPQIDADDAIHWVVARKGLIALTTAAGFAVAVAFGQFAQPRYTVYTDILVPPSNLQVVSNDLYASSAQSDAQVLEVESRMRVIASGNVLRRVAEKLDLKDDEEFHAPPKWWDLRAYLMPKHDAGDPVVPVMRELSERIKVMRQERSYLVTVAVWSWSPQKSVQIANALAEAFRDELARGDASGAAQAASTLTDRLSELKNAVSVAEEKVQAFRKANNLQQGGQGLVSTQSMSQINAKLIDAQARETEAASRYRELTQARAGALDPSSSLQSPTLTQLRVQYAELKRQVESMSITYGARHPALVTIRTQLRAIEREVQNETARIMASAKLDLDQARATLKGLSGDIEKARGTVTQDEEAQVRLRELERDAVAKSQIYQAFLVRAGEAAQREQVDATSVRVVSTAVPPERRSYPPRTLYLALAGAILGFGLGCALALAFGFLGAYRRELRKA